MKFDSIFISNKSKRICSFFFLKLFSRFVDLFSTSFQFFVNKHIFTAVHLYWLQVRMFLFLRIRPNLFYYKTLWLWKWNNNVLFTLHNCCIIWPAFGCCATPTLVKIFIFSFFVLKSWKMQKSSKFGVKYSKKTFLGEYSLREINFSFIHSFIHSALFIDPTFLWLSALLHKKHWKWLFWPAIGAHTQTLVEIYNKQPNNAGKILLYIFLISL